MPEALHLSFGLPVAIIRPLNTFGPRQPARAVIPTTITQALTQPAVRLVNLEPTRDFTYVADTVEGGIRIAECPEAIGQVINIGSGQEISIGDFANTILELVGRNIPITCDNQRVRPENSEVGCLCADYSKARDMPGWQPRYTLRDGLVQTIEWVEKNLERYRLGVYAI